MPRIHAMYRSLSALCLLAGFASPACACFLITSNMVFAPSVPETFQWDKASLNRTLPAPKLKTQRIDRVPDIPTDHRQRIEACRSGKVSVRIYWPRAATAKLDKIGFQFKVQTKDSGLAVAQVPVTGVQEGDSMRFDFLLFESPYVTNKPLAIKMEVYAVNAKMQRGPASTHVLRAPVAGLAGKHR
jgi:hypothetical protein